MKKKTELGTSLLEVIAVMTIVGILSFSTFSLYAKAMNTLRSNYVIQQVFLKASELNTSAVGNRHKTVDLKVIEKDELSYGFSFENYTKERESDQIIVSVKGPFTDGMCELLKEKISSQEYQGLKNIIVPVDLKVDEREGESNWSLDRDSCLRKGDEIEYEDGSKKKIQEVKITSMTFIIDAGFERQKF